MAEQDFDWERFKKNNRYTDEELQRFKEDPRKMKGAKRLFSAEAAELDLIVEVVESHGCTAGMKPGDRLVFNALAILNFKESSGRWCAQSLGEIPGFANMAQDRFISGLDPNDMFINHFSCMDAGARCGWGQVIMKVSIEKNRSGGKKK
jgi:uncharacterized repeat protein (TIGR04076 family)